jgi:hypothetical protein
MDTNDELGRFREKGWPILSLYQGIFLEGLRKIIKNSSVMSAGP